MAGGHGNVVVSSGSGRAPRSSPKAHLVPTRTALLLVSTFLPLVIVVTAALAAGIEPAVITAVSSVTIAAISAGLTLHGYRRQSDHWRREAWAFLWCSVEQRDGVVHLSIENKSSTLPALNVYVVTDFGIGPSPEFEPEGARPAGMLTRVDHLGVVPAGARVCTLVEYPLAFRVSLHLLYETHLGDVAASYYVYAQALEARGAVAGAAWHPRRLSQWELQEAAPRLPERHHGPSLDEATVDELLAAFGRASANERASSDIEQIRREGDCVRGTLSWCYCEA